MAVFVKPFVMRERAEFVASKDKLINKSLSILSSHSPLVARNHENRTRGNSRGNDDNFKETGYPGIWAGYYWLGGTTVFRDGMG